MKLNYILGDTLVSPSGSLPGCVGAPWLYIFYRQTCQHKRSHKLKFVNDSVIVSLLSSRDCLSDCHRLVQVILLVAECLQDKRESY